jgi:hypothetical protein
MPLQISGQFYKGGAQGPIVEDQQTALLVSEFNGRYYNMAYAGLVFFGANTAVQALSVASATFTGLALANPVGSSKNLALLEITFATATAPTATGAVVLGYAPVVALTAGSSSGPSSSMIGAGAGSVAKVGASATLGAAPTVMRGLLGVPWSTGVGFAPLSIKDDVGGVIIIPPGQLICIEAITTAISGISSFTWAELPI